MFKEETIADLIWDGNGTLYLPEKCRNVRQDQLLGTIGERLAEYCGRECYNSFDGKGRSSKDYHSHIIDVGHLSVWEHYNFTIEIPYHYDMLQDLIELANRPGVWLRILDYAYARITYNPRVVLDWDKFPFVMESSYREEGSWIRDQLKAHLAVLCPNLYNLVYGDQRETPVGYVVEPETDDEKWITLCLDCSRGCEMEQNRHGDFTAISSRSTRFVNEVGSPYTKHPAIAYLISQKPEMKEVVEAVSLEAWEGSNRAYRLISQWIEELMVSKSVNPFNARKQSRGAGRGFLGNALNQVTVFSANVSQWKRMLHLRYSNPADAEIRFLYNNILTCLKKSRYADCFENYNSVEASDGLGKVLHIMED